MDVDGTLTDGKIYIGNNGELFKAFNVKDGYGISNILKAAGIEPVIITGRTSDIVAARCKELGIEKIYQGKMHKKDILYSIVGDDVFNCCAYIGDDIPDLECMKLIKEAGGKTGCPKDAVKIIKDMCCFVSSRNAGDGAVREFIEWLVAKKEDAMKFFP